MLHNQDAIIKACLDFIRNRQNLKQYDQWLANARPNQLPPEGDWLYWLILAGRGFGKTRTGAETIRMWVEDKKYYNIALIGQTIDDVKKVMVEGVSGLLSICNQQNPLYEKSKHRLTWSSGAVATFYRGDFYEKLRGPQFDCAWIDELAKFRSPEQLWEQLMLSLRLGNKPRCIITTTPRPVPILKELMANPYCTMTTGSTFENSKNLAPQFLRQVIKQFDGTRLGAQELYAQMMDEYEGALWNRNIIKYLEPSIDIRWQRIVIAVDPATTSNLDSDETGIIVAAKDNKDYGYILADLSGKFSASDWAKRVVNAYHNFKADRVVAEVNQGGDMVEKLLRIHDHNISYKGVHASRGKLPRAEPIAALYEQGKIFHAKPFPELEKQLCNFVSQKNSNHKSPDRLDALVWSLSELYLMSHQATSIRIWS